MPTFTKEERLTGEMRINYLFAHGSSFVSYPFRVIWIKEDQKENSIPVKILFSIPKRLFGKATDRNLLRRRIRESYRLNKQIVFDAMIGKNQQLVVAVIYTGKEILEYKQIVPRVQKMLQTLIQHYEKVNQ